MKRKPNGYWTYERCKEEALKYNYKEELRRNSSSAYNVIYRNKWFELFKQLPNKIKPNGYWTYERCKEVAHKCNSYSEMYKQHSTVINKINENKWFELLIHLECLKKPNSYYTYEVCKEISGEYNSHIKLYEQHPYIVKKINKNKWYELLTHLESSRKPKGYWTYERCREKALKYTTLCDFNSNGGSVVNVINKNKWYELIMHLKRSRKPNGYWTYEKCREEALKYSNMRDLQKYASTTYNIIIYNKWSELLAHMLKLGNRNSKMVYVYEFPDNHFYVGITYDIEERNYKHLGGDKRSSVYKHIEKTDTMPKLIKKTDYIDVDKSCKLEGEVLLEYKGNNWLPLNKAKTGGVGGNVLKWNKEAVHKEALKYNKISEFQVKSGSAYSAALKNNWINDVCSHIIRCKSVDGFWNDYNKCKNESIKYKNRSAFQKNNWSAYNYSKINNWLEEFY